MGLPAALFLAKSAVPSEAWEGSLAYGFAADHSGGTAADSHGLPRIPCLQIKVRVYVAHRGVSMQAKGARFRKRPLQVHAEGG
jgi:hypothetical protein